MDPASALKSLATLALATAAWLTLGASPTAEAGARKPARWTPSYCPAPFDPMNHMQPGFVRPFQPCRWSRQEGTA